MIYNEVQLKMSRCEEIAEQIMGKILTDEEECPFQDVDVDSIEGQYLQNEANKYVGYRMSFSGSTPSCLFTPNAFDDETN